MANYEIDPATLRKYVPCHTELDDYAGKTFVSLVGFLFKNTRVLGLKLPFHHSFEEVNLRFYVRYKEGNNWKRGVVFMKEIVPRHMVTFIANSLYGENYSTHRMRHSWTQTETRLNVAYEWAVKGEWNFLTASTEIMPSFIAEGSEEEFITEHYWGYTLVSDRCTGVYEVAHPKWRVHKVVDYDVHCNTRLLYGAEFEEALGQSPSSVFLAEGSAIEVRSGSKLFK